MRRRSALDPTSIAAKRGISRSQPNGAIEGTLAHMRLVHRIVTIAFPLWAGSGVAAGCASDPPTRPT